MIETTTEIEHRASPCAVCCMLNTYACSAAVSQTHTEQHRQRSCVCVCSRSCALSRLLPLKLTKFAACYTVTRRCQRTHLAIIDVHDPDPDYGLRLTRDLGGVTPIVTHRPVQRLCVNIFK